MKLQTRLQLSYGYLVTLVLIGAIGGALGFHALGKKLGVVLDENFESVQASMAMLEALERQDSAVLMALLSKEGARTDVEASESAFLEALGRARNNVTEEQERPAIESISQAYSRYRAARDHLLDAVVETPLARYESDCFPYFDLVKTGVRDLLELNHRAMVRADREAQTAAAQRAIGYAALTALALMSLGMLSHSLRRNIISRLGELHTVAESVGRGDLRRRAAEEPSDELGEVARELNRLLDSHEELRSRLAARPQRLREIVIGLLRERRSGAALLTLDGEIFASTLDAATTERIEAEGSRLAGTEAAQPVERDVVLEGKRFRVQALLADNDQPIGWLVAALDSTE